MRHGVWSGRGCGRERYQCHWKRCSHARRHCYHVQQSVCNGSTSVIFREPAICGLPHGTQGTYIHWSVVPLFFLSPSLFPHRPAGRKLATGLVSGMPPCSLCMLAADCLASTSSSRCAAAMCACHSDLSFLVSTQRVCEHDSQCSVPCAGDQRSHQSPEVSQQLNLV